MAKKEIIIDIDENGEISMEAMGYQGKGCHEDISKFLKALGNRKSTKKKPEYYQKRVGVNRIKH